MKRLGFVVSMPLTVDASQGFLGAVVVPSCPVPQFWSAGV